jgi:uncharacterized ion transporter superfamily protein YfcC
MKEEQKKQPKAISMPHTFVIIFFVVLFAALLQIVQQKR